METSTGLTGGLKSPAKVDDLSSNSTESLQQLLKVTHVILPASDKAPPCVIGNHISCLAPTLYSQSPALGASSHIHHVQDSCALRISALFEHSALCTTPTDNTAPLIPQVSTHTTFHTAFLTLQVSIGGLRFGVLSNIPLGNWEGRSRLKPSLIITAEFQKSLKPNNTDLSCRKFPLKLNLVKVSF